MEQDSDPLFTSYFWKHHPSTLQIVPYIGPFDDVTRIIRARQEAWLAAQRLQPAALRRARLAALRDPCRSIYGYERLNRIDEGSYGIVFRAKAQDSEEVVAIKSVKLQREREGYPVTSLREITLLRKLKHKNIVRVLEVVTGDAPDQVFVVMEYVKHELKSLLTQGPNFSHSQIKYMFRDLLRALAYLHQNWIFHRDLKTSNLLLTQKGTLKLCDFGLARHFSHPLRPYTPIVVTLWYRAPELLLGTSRYSEAIDIWSAGCVFAEMLLSEPLFPGRIEMDQLDKIFRILGPPKQWPEWRNFPMASKVSLPKKHSSLRAKFPSAPYEDQFYLSDLGVNLLQKLLCYDPSK